MGCKNNVLTDFKTQFGMYDPWVQQMQSLQPSAEMLDWTMTS